MKKFLAILLFPTALILGGCFGGDKTNVQYQEMPAPTPSTAQPQPANTAAQTSAAPAPDTSATPPPASTTSTSTGSSNYKPWNPNAPATTTTASPATNYPKGYPVSGKPGFVRSPYAEHAGLVDVQGYASGTQVKCPYTGKIFLVP